MSTYSPSFSPDFGCLILIKKEFPSVKATSFHVRSEEGEKAFVSEAKISPNLVEAKNEVVAADQTTCLSRGSQSVAAIMSPKVRSRENVITRLVGDFW